MVSMLRIAVMTSGGDSPGMNAAVRAVVRKSIYHGIEVIGINRGFNGFIEGDMWPMNLGSVADIIHRGGTILHTARSEGFTTDEGKAKAYQNIERFGVEGIVLIGGNGSFAGANAFYDQYSIPVACIPSTIDNDIPGTEYTIGFDTAVNNVVDAINKIRDTATSHERTFVVEVMGRDTGLIALTAGLAGGAETIIIPEVSFDIDEICQKLMRGVKRGKLHSVLVVSEGAASGIEIGQAIKDATGFDTKVTILGHLQRGGIPTAYDRVIASRMGAKAVDTLMEGGKAKAVGINAGKVFVYDLADALNGSVTIDKDFLELANILSI